MGIICVKCKKKVTDIKYMRGSFKHPYCSECFTKVWQDDEHEYFKWLYEKHVKKW